jgi:probable rRNA maturation factor
MEPRSRRPGPDKAGNRAEDGEITVLLASPGWRAAVPRPEALARRAVAAALDEAGARGAITVLLADDAAVKRLNGRHRAKSKSTNVLSFPAGSPGYLGDLALALGVVRREARQAGRRAADHLAHLVAHGALHLAGHDHLHAGEARRMERAEARVMRRLGRPNPWKEGRAPGASRHGRAEGAP